MCARRFESINNNFRSNQINRSQGKNLRDKLFHWRTINNITLFIYSKRSLMMVQCVTYFGLIPRTPLVGVFRLVELDFYLDQTLFENSTMQIILIWYVELISWLWKDINGISMKQFLQFGQRPITVTGRCIVFLLRGMPGGRDLVYWWITVFFISILNYTWITTEIKISNQILDVVTWQRFWN